MEKDDKKFKQQKKEGWGSSITEDELNAQSERELEPGSEAYIGIFDLFFERNGLGTLVDILTGKIFQRSPPTIVSDVAVQLPGNSENPNSGEGEAESTLTEKKDKADGEKEADGGKETEAETTVAEDDNPGEVPEAAETAAESPDAENKGELGKAEEGTHAQATLLPSLKVATQAVQSVSILVQNVSRATSLYFVLSNNYINALIDLPLHLYSAAERKKVANNMFWVLRHRGVLQT